MNVKFLSKIDLKFRNVKVGDIVDIQCNKMGNPTDIFWSRRYGHGDIELYKQTKNTDKKIKSGDKK